MLTGRLRGVALLAVGRTGAALGLAGVRLLRSRLRSSMLTVVALVLMTISSRPLLSVWHLLSIRYISVLHAHRVSLSAWGYVALPGKGTSLLGSRGRGSPLLLLL